MSIKNSSSKFASLLSMAMMMGDITIHPKDDINDLNPKDIDVTPKSVIQKGMKRFIIEGVEIYAINEKNAIKKFKKL